jgi:hypothetical protein
MTDEPKCKVIPLHPDAQRIAERRTGMERLIAEIRAELKRGKGAGA